MSEPSSNSKSITLMSVLKVGFFALLFLQLIPGFITGIRSFFEDVTSSKISVGYLEVSGTIIEGNKLIKQIRTFLKNDDIKGILLKINSPGGYSGASYAIFNELKKLNQKKPIVATIENVGASGAYYIALAAQSIIATPLSLVGSIGVFMALPNVRELMQSWKVDYHYIQSGDYKTAGSATKILSNDELGYLQRLSDDQYEQFVKDVAAARSLDVESHKKWANGKIFTGSQALDLQLIDKLGSFSDAIDEMKKILNTEEDLKIVPSKKHTGLVNSLMGDDDVSSVENRFANFCANVWQRTMTICSMANNNVVTHI